MAPRSQTVVAIPAVMRIKDLVPPKARRKAILANPWSTLIRWVLSSEPVLSATLLADDKATRRFNVDLPTPHLPTRMEEPNLNSRTTYLCLELGMGRQVLIITKKPHTSMKLHHSTAPTAMGLTEVNNPSFEMCKHEETRE